MGICKPCTMSNRVRSSAGNPPRKSRLMLTRGQRRWPQFPVAISRITWIIFALLLAISGLQVTFYVIAGSILNLPIAVALIATSIGVVLCRPWAYRIAFAYPLVTIVAVLTHPLVAGRDTSLRFIKWLVRLFEALPLGLIADEVARYFSWWGVPGVASATAFLLVVLALLNSSERRLALPRGGAAEVEVSRDREHKLSTLKWIARACGLAILVPIGCVAIVAIGDPPGSSPGGFGGGYRTFFAAIIAAPIILAGAIGLAITLVMRRRLKEQPSI
ncbi:hypothetical protein [Lacipirellula sp.]|uniref:hypothetical protein n=1 Tax=Lacipirellula sp. TaxID=2691419 RepID=UPI003D0CB78C